MATFQSAAWGGEGGNMAYTVQESTGLSASCFGSLVCEDLRGVRVGCRDADLLAMEGKVAEF